jgi:hypothetical protein
LDPIKTVSIVANDKTVVTSNKTQQKESIANGAADNNMKSFAKTHAVADMGATSLFMMKGLKMSNV